MTIPDLRRMARTLGFRTIDSNWTEYAECTWLKPLLEAEQKEREQKGLERRIKDAEIGAFKPMSQFDWSWPQRVDRMQIEEFFSMEFLEKGENLVLIGNNGLGKTMIAQNLAYQAAMTGYSTLFIKASKMLANLQECKDAAARKRMLKKLCRVSLLVIDEVGYMNYSNGYADLLYEVISGRYEQKSTIVTTNTIFKEWSVIFPSAACVVTMVDQLVHHSEICVIAGKSYRNHEAEEKAAAKAKTRQAKNSVRGQAS